jgi:hypothetical protein
LNLKFGFGCGGPSSENFKYQLEPVYGFHACGLGQVIGLNRFQKVVKDQAFRILFFHKLGEFFYFSAANLILGVGLPYLLDCAYNCVSG